MSDRPRLDADVEFLDPTENPDPRCPCIVLLDTSGSMAGAPIDALNSALVTLRQELLADPVAARRVELAVVTFASDVTVVRPFAPPEAFDPPALQAGGQTAMGGAILRALELLEERKAAYREQGLSYYRPWLLLVTDGAPTDLEVLERAKAELRRAEHERRVTAFTIGVEGADLTRLAEVSVRPPVKLTGYRFADAFCWLSRSVGAVAQSRGAGQQVALEVPSGWGTVTS